MIEVVVVASVGDLRVGQRVLLAADSPLLRTGYVKEVVVDVAHFDHPVDLPGVLLVDRPEKKVTRGKSRSRSGGKLESGTSQGDGGGSESSEPVDSWDASSST